MTNLTLVISPRLETIREQDESSEDNLTVDISTSSSDGDISESLDRLIDVASLCGRINRLFLEVTDETERYSLRTFVEEQLGPSLGWYTAHYRRATPLHPGYRPGQ